MTPSWQEQAACIGHGALFFPKGESGYYSSPPDYEPALAICRTCPVLVECHAQAVHDGDIVGGYTAHGQVIGGCAPRQRQAGRPKAAKDTHGTFGGYLLHRRDGERPCGPCAEVAEANAGYAQHSRRGEVACDECKAAHARRQARQAAS